MFGWFKKRHASPTVRQEVIGEVPLPSGTLLLDDPMSIGVAEGLRIEGLPITALPIRAQIVRYPEGGERIASIRLGAPPAARETRQIIGKIGIDSATVVALDATAFERHWQEVGPARIGVTSGGISHHAVTTLIERQFGLRARQTGPFLAEFVQPISEELEAQIIAFLQTFPKYAKFPFIYFRIKTNNTQERISDAMTDCKWSDVTLDDASGSSLIAMKSGFGDGIYTVDGIYSSGDLFAVEVEFVGPAQEKIIKAFPMLRH